MFSQVNICIYIYIYIDGCPSARVKGLETAITDGPEDKSHRPGTYLESQYY